MKRSPLKKISRSKRNALDKYWKIHQGFLSRPENRFCHICIATSIDITKAQIDELLKDGYGGFQVLALSGALFHEATELHHKFGRAGRLLNDERGFIPSCRGCRLWPHENPQEARRLGLLAPPWNWNVRFENHR